MKAVDVDADGNLDVLAASGVGPLAVLRGNGDGTFDEPEYWFTDAVAAIETGDFNRDGILDVVGASGYEYAGLFFIAGTGAGEFDAYRSGQAIPASVSEERDAGDTATGDVNGDGKPDLIVVTRDSAQDAAELAVMLNTGGGIWAPAIFTELLPYAHPKLAVGDLNGDGMSDVVVGADVYLGKPDGTLHPRLPAPSSRGRFLVGRRLHR